MIDRSTKLLLAAIAAGLFANALAPLVHPIAAKAAAESFHCSGSAKVNVWGATTETIGGYNISVDCM